MWTEDRGFVPPQLRNNTQSGLRVLQPQNWMFVDKDRFEYEIMLSRTMMREDFEGREAMLITELVKTFSSFKDIKIEFKKKFMKLMQTKTV